MLNWLFPRAPVDPVEKAWVETRMCRLADQFGLARMIAARVPLPPSEFYSGTCDGSPHGAQRLLERLCDHMTIEPMKVELEVCSDERMPAVVGDHKPGLIRIADRQLDDPEALTATLAHELASSLLRSSAMEEHSERQLAWLADLLAAYLGLGIFMANAVMRESTAACGNHSCGSARKQNYLPARMVGYALALFAITRCEVHPPWKSHLRLDALAAFDGGIRYLRRTSDSLFKPDNVQQPRREPTPDELVRQLATRSDSTRIAALWDLRDEKHAVSAAEAVTDCLHDRLPSIREEAIKTLAFYGDNAAVALPMLMDLTHDSRYSIRSAAAITLGRLAQDEEHVVPHLAGLLLDPDREVVFSAATAIRSFSQPGASAIGRVLAALKVAMIRCDHPLIDALTHTLYALDPDPTERVMQFFEDDPELREQAVHIIVDALRS